MPVRKVNVEDAQRPLIQLASLVRLPQLTPGGPQTGEDAGDEGMVRAELPLPSAQRPFVQLPRPIRLPQIEVLSVAGSSGDTPITVG
jgi:hypothetical protein